MSGKTCAWRKWIRAVAKSYSGFDCERFVPETYSSSRSDFARDRGRLLHSSALRRLAAKTQVLSPTAGLDFARNRLTHSLEVAQIGRELASRLGLDADVVETACLAHDLGHPPFGHNGERALSEWATACGGFEGNAQSFRLLTRLEPKSVDSTGVPRGLNLTRGSLLASIKYPWSAEAPDLDPSGREKFGVYSDDRKVFEWAREGLPERRLTLEAEVMDFSDDVAYSVHDFEDAIVEGFIDPAVISDPASAEALIEEVGKWSGGMLAKVQLEEAFALLQQSSYWLREFDGSPRALAQLKNLTSDLIGSFVSRTCESILENASRSSLTRYRAGVIIPSKVRSEIAVLKGIVASQVMTSDDRQGYYEDQRTLLIELAETLLASNGNHLDSVSAEAWRNANNDEQRKRVIVDQVASLTDPIAVAMHESLRS